ALERDDRPLRPRAALAGRRAIPAAEQSGELALGLGRRALDPRDRQRAALAADPRRNGPRHALFRNAAHSRSDAGFRFAGAAEAVGLWRRPHVLFTRRLTPRAARGCEGALSRGRADAAGLS